MLEGDEVCVCWGEGEGRGGGGRGKRSGEGVVEGVGDSGCL